MTDVDYWYEDDPYEPDDSDDQDEQDFDDDPYDREPDPEDAEIAQAYEEEAEHRDQAHGGGECDCRPSTVERLAHLVRDTARRVLNARARLTIAAQGPLTVRLGRAEVTLRLNADRACGACGGQGWRYSFSQWKPDLRPQGYNGVGLCGCGAAIGRLADARHEERLARTKPPF